QEGGMPGIDQKPEVEMAEYTTIATLELPIDPGGGLEALALVPLTARNQALRAYTDDLATAYVQNFTLELQRELADNLTMEVRYVGTRGRKRYGAMPINRANIFEIARFEAFSPTRAGGDSPLFDRMLAGLDLGLGVVDGVNVTGSASLRQSSLFQQHLAN